jgi:hypothetical protein
LTNFMRYDEFRPAEALAKFIKCFWMLESAAAPSASPERILPDECFATLRLCVSSVSRKAAKPRSRKAAKPQSRNILTAEPDAYLVLY